MTAKENNNALIIFSRLPIGKETKTRLSRILSEGQREGLHIAMWQDIFSEVMKLNETDIFLYWTGPAKNIKNYSKLIPTSFNLMEQTGAGLGERMSNAIKDIMQQGYEKAVVIGSDIPSVKVENLMQAFDALKNADVVIGPSSDGGYWLIGMRKFIPEVFDVPAWGNSSVLDFTVKNLKISGLKYTFVETLQDIDTPDDVIEFMNENPNQDTATYSYLSKLI